jgi:MATE family multidrug resistance protein
VEGVGAASAPLSEIDPRAVSAAPPVTRAELVRLAVPAAASGILNNAFRVIDQYAAGTLGTDAQAAIGACTFVLIAFWASCALVAMGAGPLVARATGAGDLQGRAHLFATSLGAAAAIGLTLGGLLIVGAPTLAGLLGLQGTVAANAATFLRTLSIGGVLFGVAPLLDAVLVALGRTRTMFVLQGVTAVLNAALNTLFLRSLGMGIEGTALATLISRGLTTVIGVYVLWRALKPQVGDLRPSAELHRVVRIGAPVTVNTWVYALVYFLLLRWAITPLGPTTTAALGIGFSALEGVTYPMYLGVSLGVSSLVGRQLGAGRPDEAERASRLGLPMVTALGALSGLVFWFGGRPLCGLFTHDPAVLEAAVLYAHVLAFSQVFVALEALAEGVLQGAGHTRPIFWFSAPLNTLRVPLGWALAFPAGLGAAGVWWAINLTSFAKALGKGTVAARGGWKRLRIG